jgi:hypothetical protein
MTTPNSPSHDGESRREFLKKASATAAFVAGVGASGILPAHGAEAGQDLSLVCDKEEPLMTRPQVKWALEELQGALSGKGVRVEECQRVEQTPQAGAVLLVTGPRSNVALECLAGHSLTVPDASESIALVPGKVKGRRVILATGSDAQGMVYTLLELVDRLRMGTNRVSELNAVGVTIQQPANRIRSIARLFASEVEDKEWFNDRAFWQSYLTELATHRFNRFNLTLGLGYDFTRDIKDAYFHFAYPFFVSVPGYAVRAVPLPEDEQKRNLEMLQFISQETAKRGLHFQLGLWTHAYRWENSPNANYVIEGLTAETHGNYCRDALTLLLKECPDISGVTLRIHGESGVAEGSYDFWRTVFDGVARCGRRVETDLHAKGIDSKMIELALATGLPVNVSPKFWAEHMGLGYMQGAIRPTEMPPREKRDAGFFSMSTGSRSFTRYGYADLLSENRRYGIMHRVWPGTQRLLLWGDPKLAADYGRASSFCGSLGVEWLEPLSFKGRKGSGLPGGRNAYADESLRPNDGDYQKYLYSYRVWGRHIYDPDCDPEQWQRFLRKDFGKAAPQVESALGSAGRILPLITTAHCPSAANNNYWPEMYWNMAITEAKIRHPYSDTPSPKRFEAVSPLDPEFFSRINDFAEALLEEKGDARYSPLWVAAELESAANAATDALRKARTKESQSGASFRRMAADVEIQCGIGTFFAEKFRAGVLFAIYERTKFRPALEEALKAYRKARDTWAAFAEGAKPIYQTDVTFGPEYFQRGHWQDRLGAIDEDIHEMENQLVAGKTDPADEKAAAAKRAVAAVLQKPTSAHAKLEGFHFPPSTFRRGGELRIETAMAPKVTSVRLRFRHLNQGELWQVSDMELKENRYSAVIPGSYTDSDFPLQYHFELHKNADAWLFPGLSSGWKGQPYFVVHAERS